MQWKTMAILHGLAHGQSVVQWVGSVNARHGWTAQVCSRQVNVKIK
jgi:hypothetical protein